MNIMTKVGLLFVFLSTSYFIIKPDLKQNFKSNFFVPIEKRIERSLNIRLSQLKRKLSNEEKKDIISVLKLSDEKYGIDYKDLIAMISLESRFNKNVKSCNYEKRWNRSKRKFYRVCKSIDFGYTQQNSKSLADGRRIQKAKKLLTSNKIKFTNNIYDTKLNIMCAVVYYLELRKILYNNGDYSYHKFISSYNTGISGYRKYPKKAQRYFEVFSSYKVGI